MGTKELYLEDSYLTTCESTVHKIDGDKVIQIKLFSTLQEVSTILVFLSKQTKRLKGMK